MFFCLIGLEGNSSIATSPSVWAGVVIIPSSKAYEPSLDQQNEEKEEEMVPSNDQSIADQTMVDENGINKLPDHNHQQANNLID